MRITALATILALALVAAPAYVPPVVAASSLCVTSCYLEAQLAYLQCLDLSYPDDYCTFYSQQVLVRCLAGCPLPK